jgi:hypothetical protein
MKRACMANWEYAALVNEASVWHLVKPANMEPAQIEYSRDNERKLIADWGMKWHLPTTWRKYGRTIKSRYVKNREGKTIPSGHSNLSYDETLAMKSIKPKAVDDGSEPAILYSSHDLLTTINLAGQEGWEITGGIGLDNFQWRDRNSGGPVGETRWRIMRREL